MVRSFNTLLFIHYVKEGYTLTPLMGRISHRLPFMHLKLPITGASVLCGKLQPR